MSSIFITIIIDPILMKFNILILGLIFFYTCGVDSGSVGEDLSLEPGIYEFENPAENGMVVSAHPLASKTGLDILKKGGNAIDAAIAVQFALAVVYPAAGNIGGGGFMVVRMHNGEINSLDFREKAPLMAEKDMYLDSSGNVIDQLSLRGHLACGVPGSVDGMAKAYNKYGTLKWGQLVQPAIELANKGYRLTQKEAVRLNIQQTALLEYNTVKPDFLIRSNWQEGDRVINPDLGATLERIRDLGKDGFYGGETAELILEEMKRGNGIITQDDLDGYESIWRKPITGNFMDMNIISIGPPSSGGILFLQILKMIEPHLNQVGLENYPDYVHLVAEMAKKAYADRSEHIGDLDFYEMPLNGLLNPKYISDRSSSFSWDTVGVSSTITPGEPLLYESDETTHFSIVDPYGNAVALTTTLNGSYGSKVVVAEAGFILNNEMDDFSIKPGFPNLYGLTGSIANSIAPEKRMVSSMTPSIIEKNGQLYMVIGSPGGSKIITSVLQAFLLTSVFNLPIQESVAKRRFHHQWLPDTLYYEEGALSENDIIHLMAKGHPLKKRSLFGKVDAIVVSPQGLLIGGADPRGDDAAFGY